MVSVGREEEGESEDRGATREDDRRGKAECH